MKYQIKNKLKISGDSDQMEELFKKSNGKISLEALLPIDDSVDYDDAEGELEMWGTDCILVDEDDPAELEKLNYKIKRNKKGEIQTMTVQFITAYAPALLFFSNIQHSYPDVQFLLEYVDIYGDKGIAQTRFDDGKSYFDISSYMNGANRRTDRFHKWLELEIFSRLYS